MEDVGRERGQGPTRQRALLWLLEGVVAVALALRVIGMIQFSWLTLIVGVVVLLLTVIIPRANWLRPVWLRQPRLPPSPSGLEERGYRLERRGIGKALTDLQFGDDEGVADA